MSASRDFIDKKRQRIIVILRSLMSRPQIRVFIGIFLMSLFAVTIKRTASRSSLSHIARVCDTLLGWYGKVNVLGSLRH
jgi:hypothetical protein